MWSEIFVKRGGTGKLLSGDRNLASKTCTVVALHLSLGNHQFISQGPGTQPLILVTEGRSSSPI